MNNVPVIKIGIVAVSRDCFPESLAVNRRKAVVAKYEEKFGKESIYECPITIVESEIHAQQALEDVKKAGCNALCVSGQFWSGDFRDYDSRLVPGSHDVLRCC